MQVMELGGAASTLHERVRIQNDFNRLEPTRLNLTGINVESCTQVKTKSMT